MIQHDPLIGLPTHILAHITGERRKRLLEYLLRWGEHAAALACLDFWLAGQPHLATLREARARVLIEQDRVQPALETLDEIDEERGMSESRRALRMRGLAALGRWDAAHALLPKHPSTATDWRLHAELLTRQGRFEEAAAAYAHAADLLPEGSAPPRGLAELALAQGDPARARTLIHQRQAHFPDTPLDTRDLLLLRQIAERLANNAALTTLEDQLRARRTAEQTAVCAEIGFDPDETSRPRDQEIGRQTDRETRRRGDSHINTLPVSGSPNLLASAEPALPDTVVAALREHFGYDSFRPGQATVVDRVLKGESVLAVLPTGAGKSLTYQLPALLMPGATLVLSPLIALMKDQIDNLPLALAARATTIHSGLDSDAVAARLRGVAEGHYKLIYVAPERLRQQPFVHALRRAGVGRIVVDEAHCVSLWGISFRPDYLFIRRALAELGSPPLLALTATATPDTEAEIKAHLGDLTTIRTSIFRSNLQFEVKHVANRQEKLETVVALCKAVDGPVVVYVRSRDGCEEVAARLRQSGVVAEHYHAQVADRAGVQDRFMCSATRVLVATVAFGMGVDKADVRTIIHYNMPQSVEAYYQEAGRAGRDGEPARCVLLYASADKGQLTSWLREEALSKDYLRGVYRWLRQQISGTWGVVALDDLRRDLREEDEGRMRVALGLLERVELLTRHFDLPRAVTLLLRDEMRDDAAFQTVVSAARLRPGQPLDIDLIALAEHVSSTPDALERQLLRWHDQGLLRYEGSARDVLLELLPATANVGSRIDALLAEYSTRQDARIEAITTYARGLTCRHRAIAAHFGERLAACRSACDICTPAHHQPLTMNPEPGVASGEWRVTSKPRHPSPVTRRPSPVTQEAILEAVQELPGQLNDKELVCVLLGEPGYPPCAAFGRLAGADFMVTRQSIAALVTAGRLAWRNRTLVPASTVARLATPATPAAIEETILRCLTQLPFPVGKSGLAKILKGAAGSPIGPERSAEYAALHTMTGAAIETEIERLVEQGRLRRSSGPRPLLSISNSHATAPANVVQ
jgi:ATP-dependent DNA helicase RecQ